MKWYYSANREKLGPIDQAAFDQLVAGGVIADQTLVWHKGMPGWRPFGEIKAVPVALPEAAAPPPPPAPAPAATGNESPGVTCVSCGAFLLMENTVRFHDDFVCLECRENYVREQDESRRAEECDSSDEELRAEGLKHERLLRTVACVYWFVGGVFALLGLGSLVSGKFPQFLIFTTFSALILLGAWQFFGFRKRAKIAVGCVSGFGLLVFPIGTLIHIFILYSAFGAKGRRVLGEQYRGVIERTPHVKAGVSWIGVILLCVAHFIAFAINNK